MRHHKLQCTVAMGHLSKRRAVWRSFHPELPGVATQIGVADVQHKEGLQHPPTPDQGEELSSSFSAQVSMSTALIRKTRTLIPPRRNLYCYMQGTASRGNGITDVALHLRLVTLESKVRMIWMCHRTRHSKRTLPIPNRSRSWTVCSSLADGYNDIVYWSRD